MDLMIWNAALSLVIGIVSWVLKDKAAELSRVTILLNKTREEIAREYVTKTEVHADINRVMNRLEVLDAKLDRLIENIRVKGPTNG
jgi:archaellum component FlaC